MNELIENYEWYVVKTPDFCDSGFQIAQYQNGKWILDTGEDITEFVAEYRHIASFILQTNNL
jgi:hypothetical protein